MIDNEKLLSDLVAKLLSERNSLIRIACRQRAKFEGWLKFELAAALDQRRSISQVEVEKRYAAKSLRRCDVAFDSAAESVYVELKTANTNWRVEGVEVSTRPISKNVTGIIEDIRKLRNGTGSGCGLGVFTFFPVPKEIWPNGEDIIYPLDRIEREAKLPSGLLRRGGKYIEVTGDYRGASFVVDVTNT